MDFQSLGYRTSPRSLDQIFDTMKRRYHLSDLWARKMANDFVGTTVCHPCRRILDLELNDGTQISLHDAIDHDHVTGVIRGRLCASCNTKEGHLKEFKDDFDGLISQVGEHEAARWIEWWGRFRPSFPQGDDVLDLFGCDQGCVPMDIDE